MAKGNKVGAAVVNAASQLSGKLSYVYGGHDIEHGISDCSWMSYWIYNKALGINVGTYSGEQMSKGKVIATDADTAKVTEVAEMGDLLLWTTHSCMYAGDGKVWNHGSGTGPNLKDVSGQIEYHGKCQINRYIDGTETVNKSLGTITAKDGQYYEITTSGSAVPSGSGGGDGSGDGGGNPNVDTLSDFKLETTTYHVQSGDTIGKIAAIFGTTIAMIMYLNNFTSSELEEGQEIIVPRMTSNDPEAAVTAQSQVIETSHDRKVSLDHPYAKVEIYTEMGLISVVQDLALSEKNAQRDILRINTNRTLSQDNPTFSVVMCYRNDWYTKISMNDLVIITMNRPPDEEKEVFFGLVDDCRKSADYNSTKPIRTLTITGRGFSKALSRFTIGVIDELNCVSDTLGFMSTSIDTLSGNTPARIINHVLEFYIGKGCNYAFSNGKSLTDYFQTSLKDAEDENEFFSDTSTFLSYSGTLWDFLKELRNAPFNELFFEIIEHRPTLVFRPTPFNPGDWVELLRYEIPDSEIVSEDIGKSDMETYTIFKVNAENFISDLDSIYLPLWYPPYYKKYGISRLEVASKYIEYTETAASSGGSGGSYGNTGASPSKNETINIPDGLGITKTYMGWNCITSQTSQQMKLRNDSGENYDSEGFGRVGDRYVVACTTTFGKIGDYLDVYHKDGTMLKCIMGDEKSQEYCDWDKNPANKWGHYEGQCIIEFIVNKGNKSGSTAWYNDPSPGLTGKGTHANPGTGECHPEWHQSITKIINRGSYWG